MSLETIEKTIEYKKIVKYNDPIKQEEIDKIGELLTSFLKKINIQDLGDEIRYLRSGGSGYIYSILKREGEDTDKFKSYCIKVLKPERMKHKEAFIAEADTMAFLNENEDDKTFVLNIKKIENKNVEYIEYSSKKLPFFIIERGISFSRLLKSKHKEKNSQGDSDDWEIKLHNKFWNEYTNSEAKLLGKPMKEMLIQMDKALRMVHSKYFYHLDVKAENILVMFVDENWDFRLFDFGSKKSKSDWDSAEDNDYFETTHENLPPLLKKIVHLPEETSDKRVKVNVKKARSLIKPKQIDRHQLGKMVFDLLMIYGPFKDLRAHISKEDKETILAVADCLLYPDYLDPKNNDIEFEIYDPGYINHLTTVESIFSRINNMQNKLENMFGKAFVLIPGTPVTSYDESIRRLSQTNLFKRLNGIKQLGLAYKVYPGATHTRYEHSLGSFEAAMKYLKSLLSGSGSKWLAARVNEHDIKMCILHSLLHDIGQYPFSHYLEGIGVFPNHESLTQWILTKNEDKLEINNNDHSLVNKKDLDELHDVLENYFKIKPEHWSDWFEKLNECKKRPSLGKNPVYSVLSQIIDGPIDADKFDYLRRDATHCGFNAIGMIERELFFNSLTVCLSDEEQEVPRYSLGVREEAHCVLEQFYLARYHLFELVYCNHKVRCYTALLRDTILRCINFCYSKLNHAEIEDSNSESGYDKKRSLHEWFKLVSVWCKEKYDDSALNTLEDWIRKNVANDNDEKGILLKNIEAIKYADCPQILFEVTAPSSPSVYDSLSKCIEEKKEISKNEVSCPNWCEDYYLIGTLNAAEEISKIFNASINSVLENEGKHILIDLVTDSKVNKLNAIPRCGVVFDNKKVSGPGPIWDAIIPSLRKWLLRIRVMVRPGNVDTVDRRDIENKIIKLFS